MQERKCQPRILILLFVCLYPGYSFTAEPPPPQPHPEFYAPVEMVTVGQWLYIANQDAGSVSVLKTGENRMFSETGIGQRISSIACVGSQTRLLFTDEAKHELVISSLVQGHVSDLKRIKVPYSPVGVKSTSDGTLAVVASLWARQVTLVDINETTKQDLEISKTINIPFNPKEVWISDDDRFAIVSDAFAGHIATINLTERRLAGTFNVNVQNIRGLTTSIDGEYLTFSHQLLSPNSATVRNNVFWGNTLENLIRSVPLDVLFAPQPDPQSITKVTHWLQYPVGSPGNAAGDPGDILFTSDGELFICFGGTSQIAHGKDMHNLLKRINVGSRPIALAVDQTEQFIYIASHFDDSIEIFDRKLNRVVKKLPLGDGQPTHSLADNGKRLFYNSRLSLDGWYSCNSCHVDGHTVGGLNENLSDANKFSPKRILSLLGTGETGPWAWLGNRIDLDGQVLKSIHVTMQGGNSGLAKGNPAPSISAFLRTLQPPPGVRTARGELIEEQIERGSQLFETLKCSKCHAPPTYTTVNTYDVGIRDEHGLKDFNPPSLRGVSQRYGLFHDNRAADVRAVLEDHAHPDDTINLSEKDLESLIHFLESI
ncbi:MAG: cytochrome c peroxidase [Pirellulaceae bacterium]